MIEPCVGTEYGVVLPGVFGLELAVFAHCCRALVGQADSVQVVSGPLEQLCRMQREVISSTEEGDGY